MLMKKWLKITLTTLFLTLIVIQLFPGEKPEVISNNPNDLHTEVLVSQEVSQILRVACYDCHSNETTFPWYSSVAPASWIVLHDIEEGRRELNFSEWKAYPPDKKQHKLDELIEEVEEGEMPMKIYSAIHRDADLSEEQVNSLISWAKAEMERLNSGN